MNYLGSGKLGEYLVDVSNQGVQRRVLVVGRRLANMTLNDWMAIRESGCIFLDTIDMKSVSSGKYADRIKWWVNLYRIEKSMTFWLIKIMGKSAYRIHVPAIVDSAAWLKLCQHDGGRVITGLSYESLAAVLSHVAARQVGSLKATEVYGLCDKLKLPTEDICVRECASARLVSYAKRT